MDQWVKRVKPAVKKEDANTAAVPALPGRAADAPASASEILLSRLLAQCRPSWKPIILEESRKEYFRKIMDFLTMHPSFYPPTDSIFRAFSYFGILDTKVVIIGQDPYHGKGQAMGLAFSVNRNVAVPPSLKNIYKEIDATIGYPDGIPRHGSLVGWAEQGVFLLNTTLTVSPSSPGSHFSLEWHRFTDRIIGEISMKVRGCVFILWGSDACKKRILLDPKKHLILTSAHPSPFSAARGFFGCDHFRKANEYLRANSKGAIAWEDSQ